MVAVVVGMTSLRGKDWEGCHADHAAEDLYCFHNTHSQNIDNNDVARMGLPVGWTQSNGLPGTGLVLPLDCSISRLQTDNKITGQDGRVSL